MLVHYVTAQEACAAYALIELRSQHKALNSAELTTVMINLFSFEPELALQITVEGVRALAGKDLVVADLVHATRLVILPLFDADLEDTLREAKQYIDAWFSPLTEPTRPLHPQPWTSRPAWMDQAFQDKLRLG